MSALKATGFYVLAVPVALFRAFYSFYYLYRLVLDIPPGYYIVTRMDVRKRELKVYAVDNRN